MKTHSKRLPSPLISKTGALSPIDPENSAENRSKKPAAKHCTAKATMEFNRNVVQDGAGGEASQGFIPPSAVGRKQKAL